MKKPKEIALEKLSSLPENVSFGRILQEIIHLKHTELLALEEWIPTPKQSSEIEKMCKKFTKPELIIVAQECGLDLSKCGGDYKVLIASSLRRKGLSFEDVERVHKYKKMLE
jgi:predicted CopG family antitoxin